MMAIEPNTRTWKAIHFGLNRKARLDPDISGPTVAAAQRYRASR